ncbi:UNVERIFIED_CONTAM: hypothetical protein Sindi_1107300, partial [Sesamum indicum]
MAAHSKAATSAVLARFYNQTSPVFSTFSIGSLLVADTDEVETKLESGSHQTIDLDLRILVWWADTDEVETKLETGSHQTIDLDL